MKNSLFFVASNLIVMFCFSANASIQSCEGLFSVNTTATQIQKAAENLARFRIDFRDEPDQDQKKILKEEFELKYKEYLDLAQGNANAEQIFRDNLEKVEKALAEIRFESEKHEHEKQQQLISEQDAVRKWKGLLRFRPFGTKKPGSIRTTNDGSKLIISISVNSPSDIAELKIYNTKDMHELKSLRADSDAFSNQSVVSTDGSALAFITGKQKVTWLDLHTMEETTITPPIEDARAITKIALSMDGSKLLYSSEKTVTDKKFLELYDIKKKEKITLPQKEFDEIRQVLLATDGSKVVVNDKKSISVLDLKRKKSTVIPGLPLKPVTKMSLSSDGNFLMLYAQDETSVFIFNLQTQKTQKFDFPRNVTTSAFVSHSSWMTVAGLGFASIVDFKTGQQVNYLHSSAQAPWPFSALAALTPDANYFLIYIGGQYILLDTSFDEIPFASGDVKGLVDLKASPSSDQWFAFNKEGELFVWFRDYNEARKIKGIERLQ